MWQQTDDFTLLEADGTTVAMTTVPAGDTAATVTLKDTSNTAITVGETNEVVLTVDDGDGNTLRATAAINAVPLLGDSEHEAFENTLNVLTLPVGLTGSIVPSSTDAASADAAHFVFDGLSLNFSAMPDCDDDDAHLEEMDRDDMNCGAEQSPAPGGSDGKYTVVINQQSDALVTDNVRARLVIELKEDARETLVRRESIYDIQVLNENSPVLSGNNAELPCTQGAKCTPFQPAFIVTANAELGRAVAYSFDLSASATDPELTTSSFTLNARRGGVELDLNPPATFDYEAFQAPAVTSTIPNRKFMTTVLVTAADDDPGDFKNTIVNSVAIWLWDSPERRDLTFPAAELSPAIPENDSTTEVGFVPPTNGVSDVYTYTLPANAVNDLFTLADPKVASLKLKPPGVNYEIPSSGVATSESLANRNKYTLMVRATDEDGNTAPALANLTVSVSNVEEPGSAVTVDSPGELQATGGTGQEVVVSVRGGTPGRSVTVSVTGSSPFAINGDTATVASGSTGGEVVLTHTADSAPSAGALMATLGYDDERRKCRH